MTELSEIPKSEESYSSNTDNLYNISLNRAISESESMTRDINEGRLSGFVGNGTVLTGDTSFHVMLRVDGQLTGRVTSENGTLIIGPTGQVDANIRVAGVIINGTVNGNIVAIDKVQLKPTARVIGNIQTPKLIIEAGAIFEGGCTMLKAKNTFEKPVTDLQNQLLTSEDKTIEKIQITAKDTEADLNVLA